MSKCMHCKYRYETFGEWMERWYGREVRLGTAVNKERVSLGWAIGLMLTPVIGWLFILMIWGNYFDKRKVVKR